MLPRVARTLHQLLFALSILLLVWLPLSCVMVVYADIPSPMGGGHVVLVDGAVVVTVVDTSIEVVGPSIGLSLKAGGPRFDDLHWKAAWIPRIRSYSGYWGTEKVIEMPLWLLAAICLAWPVTSFIIARRRKRRGFEVEPAGTSNIQHPTSNIEAP